MPHGLFGSEHDAVNATDATAGPFRRIILEQSATPTNFLAIEKRFPPFDRIDDIQHFDRFGRSRQAVATAQSLAGFEDSGLFQLGKLLCHEGGGNVLKFCKIETADWLRILNEPKQTVQNVFGACAKK